MQLKPGQIGLDATLGYGGHSSEILKHLRPKGHLYAIDADPIELERTKERLTDLGYGSDILTINKKSHIKTPELTFQGHGGFNPLLVNILRDKLTKNVKVNAKNQ